jgi:ABC-2 type transport system ATP-binding protein
MVLAATPGTPRDIRADQLSKRHGRTLALDAVGFAVRPNELFALLGAQRRRRDDAHSHPVQHFVDEFRHRHARWLRCTRATAQSPAACRRVRSRSRAPTIGSPRSRTSTFTPWSIKCRPASVAVALMSCLSGRTRNRRHELARSLSAGMKRRVEIARSLIHGAALLVPDEPAGGLEAQSRERIWAYLMRLRCQVR